MALLHLASFLGLLHLQFLMALLHLALFPGLLHLQFLMALLQVINWQLGLGTRLECTSSKGVWSPHVGKFSLHNQNFVLMKECKIPPLQRDAEG